MKKEGMGVGRRWMTVRERKMGAWTVGDEHGLTRPLACDVVDLAAVLGLHVTGQEVDGSSEGVRVFQEGRDIPGNKDRIVTRVRPDRGPARSRRLPLRVRRQRLAGS